MGTKYSQWIAAACFVLAGCAQGGTRTPILGSDGGTADSSVSLDGSLESCERDEDCVDDGNFCNGSFRCFANRCIATDIPNCNDGIACTRDECDVTLAACVNTPVSTACPSGYTCRPVEGCVIMPACEFDTDCEGDGLFCNGDEVCAGGNCVSPAGGRSCDDSNSCTADGCSDDTGACVSMPHEFLTDPAHCGPTGENDCVVCPTPPPSGNAVAVCISGACDYACLEGFSDRDGLTSNFCESNCVPTGAADVPDDLFIDTDCDGVDGEVARAIFVSPTGSNGNDGFLPTTPVATIARAFDIARANPSRVQILLQTGSYGGLLSTLAVPSGIGLYGGYGVGFMSRTDSRAAFLASASPAFDIASASAPTVFDHVNVSVDARTAAGAAAIGLLVRDSGENFTLRHSIITAGAGGNGSSGAPGTVGSAGGTGNPASGETRGTGGTPGGGNGATGARQSAGAAGSTGSANGSSYGGSAGAGSGVGGLYCNDGDPSPGGDGGLGGPGRDGDHGAAGSGVGVVTATGWSGASAGTGQQGFTGGGGGGGGAGGGEDCTGPVVGCIYCGTGRGGGGGGGGGYGGSGGGAGGAGGASIAVIVSNSTLNVYEVTLRSLSGGNGGNGASGGAGGGGGGGGAGGSSSSNKDGAGGRGGAGGSGGRGGCGGGGAGGPSVALWGVGGSAGLRSLGTVTLSPGAGGLGGLSCTGGNAGGSGGSEDRLNVIVF